MTVTSTCTSSAGLPPPAVTICAVGKDSTGWKNGDWQHHQTSMEDISLYVKNNQFTLNDTVARVIIRGGKSSEEVNPVWISGMAVKTLGVCHTLIYKKPLSSMESLLIILKEEPKSYKVYLHDFTFFLQKSVSFFIPFVLLEKPKGESYEITTSQTTRMNRPGKFECNEDTSYNFNQCITDSLATKMGCLFPWAAENSNDKFQMCNTTQRVLEYRDIYNTMYLGNQQYIENQTGCQVPCRYNHYSIVGKPAIFEGNVTYVSLSFVSTDLTEVQEV